MVNSSVNVNPRNPRPCRPKSFGEIHDNYNWVECASKQNPDRTYFYNLRTHCKIWSRPVPENVVLPYFNCYAIRKETSENEEEEEDDDRFSALVSDLEEEFYDDEENKFNNENELQKNVLEVGSKLFYTGSRNLQKSRKRRLSCESENSEILPVSDFLEFDLVSENSSKRMRFSDSSPDQSDQLNLDQLEIDQIDIDHLTLDQLKLNQLTRDQLYSDQVPLHQLNINQLKQNELNQDQSINGSMNDQSISDASCNCSICLADNEESQDASGSNCDTSSRNSLASHFSAPRLKQITYADLVTEPPKKFRRKRKTISPPKKITLTPDKRIYDMYGSKTINYDPIDPHELENSRLTDSSDCSPILKKNTCNSFFHHFENPILSETDSLELSSSSFEKCYNDEEYLEEKYLEHAKNSKNRNLKVDVKHFENVKVNNRNNYKNILGGKELIVKLERLDLSKLDLIKRNLARMSSLKMNSSTTSLSTLNSSQRARRSCRTKASYRELTDSDYSDDSPDENPLTKYKPSPSLQNARKEISSVPQDVWFVDNSQPLKLRLRKFRSGSNSSQSRDFEATQNFPVDKNSHFHTSKIPTFGMVTNQNSKMEFPQQEKMADEKNSELEEKTSEKTKEIFQEEIKENIDFLQNENESENPFRENVDFHQNENESENPFKENVDFHQNENESENPFRENVDFHQNENESENPFRENLDFIFKEKARILKEKSRNLRENLSNDIKMEKVTENEINLESSKSQPIGHFETCNASNKILELMNFDENCPSNNSDKMLRYPLENFTNYEEPQLTECSEYFPQTTYEEFSTQESSQFLPEQYSQYLREETLRFIPTENLQYLQGENSKTFDDTPNLSKNFVTEGDYHTSLIKNYKESLGFCPIEDSESLMYENHPSDLLINRECSTFNLVNNFLDVQEETVKISKNFQSGEIDNEENSNLSEIQEQISFKLECDVQKHFNEEEKILDDNYSTEEKILENLTKFPREEIENFEENSNVIEIFIDHNYSFERVKNANLIKNLSIVSEEKNPQTSRENEKTFVNFIENPIFLEHNYEFLAKTTENSQELGKLQDSSPYQKNSIVELSEFLQIKNPLASTCSTPSNTKTFADSLPEDQNNQEILTKKENSKNGQIEHFEKPISQKESKIESEIQKSSISQEERKIELENFEFQKKGISQKEAKVNSENFNRNEEDFSSQNLQICFNDQKKISCNNLVIYSESESSAKTEKSSTTHEISESSSISSKSCKSRKNSIINPEILENSIKNSDVEISNIDLLKIVKQQNNGSSDTCPCSPSSTIDEISNYSDETISVGQENPVNSMKQLISITSDSKSSTTILNEDFRLSFTESDDDSWPDLPDETKFRRKNSEDENLKVDLEDIIFKLNSPTNLEDNGSSSTEKVESEKESDGSLIGSLTDSEEETVHLGL